MGDSLCFREDVLRKVGWGYGLAEDYEVTQRLLLEEIEITSEPRALAFGQPPTTWRQARHPGARSLTSVLGANRVFSRKGLFAGWRQREGSVIDVEVQGGPQVRPDRSGVASLP
jgi:hypothetical protein